jgi:hypothetical protein
MDRFIKDKSGAASLIFVMGLALLMLSAGVIAVLSGSSSLGMTVNQYQHNRLLILDKSVQENVMYSLQSDAASEVHLSSQLASALYEYNDPLLPTLGAGLGEIDVQSLVVGAEEYIGSTEAMTIKSIKFSFPVQNVVINPPIPAQYKAEIIEPEEGVEPATPGTTGNLEEPEIEYILIAERQPREIYIDAIMTVTIESTTGSKSIKTVTTYQYTGGYLSDDPEGLHSTEPHPEADPIPPESYPMIFTDYQIDGEERSGYGRWSLIQRENLDTTI